MQTKACFDFDVILKQNAFPLYFYQPFTKQKILHSSKLKELANENCKFVEYGRKFSKRVENTLGKGEIARYQQFLLSPQCFLKTCAVET